MIGKRIREIRISKQITLTALSKETGLNLGHLSHIEKGRRTPSLKSLEAIARALDIDVHDLFQHGSKETFSNMKEEGEKYERSASSIPELSIPIIQQIRQCLSSEIEADFAVDVNDESMKPLISKNSCIYVKRCLVLKSGETGLFWKDGKLSYSKENIKQDGVHFLGRIIKVENRR